jgi:hypothetical protein
MSPYQQSNMSKQQDSSDRQSIRRCKAPDASRPYVKSILEPRLRTSERMARGGEKHQYSC